MRSSNLLYIFVACVIIGNDLVKATGINNLIIGGQTAKRGQFRYVAAIRNRKSHALHCGGCILGERWILTAAHCTQRQYRRPDNIEVAVAAHTLTDGIIHRVIGVFNHPRYNSQVHDNDVSLLRTATPIKFSDIVQPARLPSSDHIDGQHVTVAGWGLIKVNIFLMT